METRNCQNCKKEFLIEPDDFSFYEKIKVPPPTFCPECRRQRRLAYRNDFVFYNRTCDFCKKNIISIYSPDNPQIIYCNKCWWGDKWDPLDYGIDFDFSKSFFEQYKNFRQRIPALALVNDNGIGSINSEYVQNVQYSKNCYMAMVSWKIENCMYFSYGADARDAIDSMGIFSKSEGVYEALYSQECFGSKYIQDSTQLINCYFCFDCRGCTDCFMCIGLRNKKFYFKNEKKSKEEYESILKLYNIGSWSGVIKSQKEFNDFKLCKPRKYANLINCYECLGNNLSNSKNVKDVFHVRKAEDCKYLENGDTEKDSYDLSVGGELNQCYEGLTPDNSTRAIFTNYVWKSLDVFYSDFCISCHDCFGCIGLKKKEFCIFNKQYPKKEYFILRDKIINHMKKFGEFGEFFPINDSPFSYNESMANVSFPLTKEQSIKIGLSWQENIQQTKGKTTLKNIPDDILNVGNNIIDEILECETCQRNYKIVGEELKFYKKWNIPIPRYCFFCRLKNRFELRNPSKLWHRKCMKEGCNNEFDTSYAPERPEIIYCESCYLNEVV